MESDCLSIPKSHAHLTDEETVRDVQGYLARGPVPFIYISFGSISLVSLAVRFSSVAGKTDFIARGRSISGCGNNILDGKMTHGRKINLASLLK